MPKVKKKNLYFTQDHEDAIVKYSNTNDIKVRTELYINWIEPAFSEMVDNFWKEVNSWETINMKPNEEKVYEAIRVIFSNPDRIEIFNKKAIYFYIREITGLNTKQVVNNLNKMRIKYRVFKKKWDKGDL